MTSDTPPSDTPPTSLLEDLGYAWVQERPFIPNCWNTVEAAVHAQILEGW